MKNVSSSWFSDTLDDEAFGVEAATGAGFGRGRGRSLIRSGNKQHQILL
jgi:hypothetical protein